MKKPTGGMVFGCVPRHLFSVPASYWLDRGLRLAARQHKVEKAELLLTRVKEEKQELELKLAQGFEARIRLENHRKSSKNIGNHRSRACLKSFEA